MNEAGHEGGHRLDIAIDFKTEEFLRAKGTMFRELWRKKIKRGLKPDEAKTLSALVDEFHATEEP